MNRFYIFPQELKTFTMFTCVAGGIFWTRKWAQQGQNLIEFETQNTSDVKRTELQHWSTTAMVGAFYGYLAININAFLLHYNLVDVDILRFGYSTVAIGLIADLCKETTDYYFKK